MTTVAVSTDSPVVEAPRQPGRIRIFFGENFGYFGTWLRLLWRHWPVLLALSLAGSLARELLLDATYKASTWQQGLGGLLVFALVPAGVLVAMVLMLRVMRPSLPYLGSRSKPESMIVYLASVLIPFLAFYISAGYLDYDFTRFGYSVATSGFRGETAYLFFDVPLSVVGVIAVAAFLLRWVLTRFEILRQIPWLGVPALYLELLWLLPVTILAVSVQERGMTWLTTTNVWHWGFTWWHATLDPAHPLTPALEVARSVVNMFLAAVGPVLLAPVTALVAGSVVLAARTRRRQTVVAKSGVRRLLMIGAKAGAPVGGRFALIADGVRRVVQAGVFPTMLFCLAYVALDFVNPLLNEGYRAIGGPADDQTLTWQLLTFPLQFVNRSVVLVLVIALIAAFVDRTAARIARRAGAPTGPAPDGAANAGPDGPVGGGPGAAAAPTVPSPAGSLASLYAEQPTTRLGPPPSVAGTPTYGGLSPVTPVYTTPAQPPPTPGPSFGPPPGLMTPPAGPSSTPPAGLTTGLWDVKPDEPREPGGPRDDEGGWRHVGR